MERKGNPRRFMSKVRKNIGRETLVHKEKNKYNRNRQKRMLRNAIDKYREGRRK
jgi:hypothetical protein